MKRHKGVTIVEILVIVAIISVLIAVFIPAINAVNRAKETNNHIKTVEIETGDWKQINVPMAWGTRNLLYTTMEIEGRRYLIVTKVSDDGGVAVVPILPAQAERE